MTKKKTATKVAGTTETTAGTTSKKVTKKKTSKKTTKKVTSKVAKKVTKKVVAKEGTPAPKKAVSKVTKATTKKTSKKTSKKTTKKVAAKDMSKVESAAPVGTTSNKSTKKSSKKVADKVEKAPTQKTIEERIAEQEKQGANKAEKKPQATPPKTTETPIKPQVEKAPEAVAPRANGLAPMPGEKISGGLLALEQKATASQPKREPEARPQKNEERAIESKDVGKSRPPRRTERKTEEPVIPAIEESKPQKQTETEVEKTENSQDSSEEQALSRSARRRRNYRNNKRKRLEQEREAAKAGTTSDNDTIETATTVEVKEEIIKTPVEPITVSAILAEKEKEKKAKAARKETGRNMLMNVVDHGELRVAIAGKSGLEEIYIEKSGGEFVHGNIFKGIVENVEPNLQAAFINIGAEKNGFLHVRDVIYPFGGFEDILGKPNRQRPTTKRPPINQMLQKGQEILVQITREQVATKGPSLTTYISLPGRYLVLMPAVKKRGVSRKITSRNERDELRKALEQLDPPNDMGYIIRTAGMGKGTEELQRDLDYLTMLWEAISNHTQNVKGPMAIYQESDLVIRAIRDYFTDSIDTMFIDSEEEYKRAQEFLKLTMPEDIKRAKYYGGTEPLFSRYNVEEEISGLFSKSVRLKSGGELIIEQTEAMVTIDVNTGRFLKGKSSHDMVLKINKEAAGVIAKQLRLRDMGGLVMIDFIDMESEEDRKNVENTFRSAMQVDRAKTTILPISSLGVMEMTRQRMRQSLNLSHFDVCKHCGGSGVVKNIATLETEFMRGLRSILEEGKDCKIKMHPDTAIAISNKSRLALTALEEEYRNNITIISDNTLRPDKFVINK